MIFDTDFLIAYARSTRALSKANARAFVEALPDAEPLLLSQVTWMEFVAGYGARAEAEAELTRLPQLEGCGGASR